MGRDPMSAMRAVTFDAGRTLLHWGVEPRRAFAELCRRAGIAVTEAGALHGARACARFWQASPPPPAGHAPEAWWLRHHAAGLRAAGVAGDLEACCRALQAAATSADAGWVVDPDAPLVLDALRARGFVLAVVANADGTVAERLGALGLADRFAFIADSAVIGARKPDPAIYHAAARAIGVPPGACVHVGDRPDADGGVALAAGATPVLYDPLDVLGGTWRRVLRLTQVLSILPPHAAPPPAAG